MASLKRLKDRVTDFRSNRESVKQLEAAVKREQPELIEALREAGVTNEVGLVYDPADTNKGAAYVQQNEPGEYWDHDGIIDWLNKPVKGRKTLRLACTTRVLDIQKFEAEVAAGNVPPKVATRLKKTGEPASPFIRFGKINDKGIS